MSNQNDSSIERFLVSGVTFLAISTGLICLFLVLRQLLPKFYHPRKRAPPWSKNPVRWVWDCMTYSERDLWKTHGVDVIMYLRFLRLCLLICLAMLIVFIVLIPVNATGTNKDRDSDDPAYIKGMAIVTTSNIEQGNWAFIAHVIFVWFISSVVWGLVYQTYVGYIRLRRRFFSVNSARNYTLLVQEIPDEIRDEEKLAMWFEDHFPGAVVSVSIPRKCSGLKKKRKHYFNAIRKLEKAEWKQEHDKKQRVPMTRPGTSLGRCGRKVEAIPWWQKKRDHWCLRAEERMANPGHYRYTPNGFVTVDNTFLTKVMVEGWREPTKLIISPAPDPSDVMWNSYAVGYKEQRLRKLAVFAFTVLLVFFWSVVVVFIASLSTLSNITSIPGFGWLQFIVDLNPVVRGLIEGLLPSLALAIFMALLIPILKFVSRLEADRAISLFDRTVMDKLLFFLFVNVLLVYSISGSIFSSLGIILDHPVDVVEILANTLPQQSTFFITYIMAHATYLMLHLSRPKDLIIYLVKRVFLAKTDKEIALLLEPPPAKNLPVLYARALLILVIVLVYSVMAPLIILFGIVYFVAAFTVDRYNLIVVYRAPYSSGGLLFGHIFHWFMAGLLIFQGVMIGLLGISYFPPGGALIPLPFITLFLWALIWRRWLFAERRGCVQDKWKHLDKQSFRKTSVQLTPIAARKEPEEEEEESEQDTERQAAYQAERDGHKLEDEEDAHDTARLREYGRAYLQPEFVPLNESGYHSPCGQLGEQEPEQAQEFEEAEPQMIPKKPPPRSGWKRFVPALC